MDKVKMTKKEMEALTICNDCRYFHRYGVRTQLSFHEKDLREDQVEIYEDVDIYSRCLIGGRCLPPMDLTECVIVDCNQFERREAKKKL